METSVVKYERIINENEVKLSQMSDTSSEEYQSVKSNLDLQKKFFNAKERNFEFTKRRTMERSLLFAVAR